MLRPHHHSHHSSSWHPHVYFPPSPFLLSISFFYPGEDESSSRCIRSIDILSSFCSSGNVHPLVSPRFSHVMFLPDLIDETVLPVVDDADDAAMDPTNAYIDAEMNWKKKWKRVGFILSDIDSDRCMMEGDMVRI